MAQSDVNVHTRALRAATRTGTNGECAIDPPELSWWQKIFSWETLTVAGREVKGFVVPQWMMFLFLGAILGGMGFMYRTTSAEMDWQHDQLVILATQKQDADRAAKQEHDDRALQESADRAWREKLSNEIAALKLEVKAGRTN